MKASVFHSLPKEIISHIKEYNKSLLDYVWIYMMDSDFEFNKISLENMSIEDCLKMTQVNKNGIKKIYDLIYRCNYYNYTGESDYCNIRGSKISIKYNTKSVIIRLEVMNNRKNFQLMDKVTLKYKSSYDNEVWKFAPYYYKRIIKSMPNYKKL